MQNNITNIDWISIPYGALYENIIANMEQKVHDVYEQTTPEAIFLVEHQKIYTAGTNFKPEELLKPDSIPVIYTGRGGKFTYHGPGQRVVYPVIDLSKREKNIRLYIDMLHQWIINTLGAIGIKAYTMENYIGIWVDENKAPAKIASIGIRIKKWVTYYGFSVNINTDLEYFSGIIACGLNNFPVTSLLKLGICIELKKFDQILKSEFYKIF